MRYMMIIKSNDESEAGKMPPAESFAAMGRFNESLVKAGVLLAAEGLSASSEGARVRLSGDQRTVIDGPFTETKELIAGFWLIQVGSRDEALEWAQRVPAPPAGAEAIEIEVRRVHEISDFPAEVFPPEEAAREQRLRETLEARARDAE
jgi:hypothetical protein